WSDDRVCFFFQAEDGIRDRNVTGVQTCALPILELAEISKGEISGTMNAEQTKQWRDFVESRRGLSQSKTFVENLMQERRQDGLRSEERRVGKSVGLGGRRGVQKKNITNVDESGS